VSDRFLAQVLRQNEHIRELIKQSAELLSTTNIGVRDEPADPLSPGEIALAEHDAVIKNLQDAAEGLTAINQTLQIEIKDRNMVDHQLAAAVEQEEASRNAALHDGLTGLANRMLFNDRLEHAIPQAKRYRWMLAVMFVDLDRFKHINDTHGHVVGDAVLQTVATRLKQSIREDDTTCRYGGDEFLCLLTHLHEQKDIAMIAAKLLEAIRAPYNVSLGDVTVSPCVSASIGISLYPRDGVTASELIKSADEAMYGVKENHSGYAFAQ
jgi:diguanylate cyclase (GGDEF)-like protein